MATTCLLPRHARGGNLAAPKPVLEWTRSRGPGPTRALGWTLVRISFASGMPFHDGAIFFFSFRFPFSFSRALYQDHVFLSINPPSGLELSNIAHKSTIEELREQIFTMWPEGVTHQDGNANGYEWRVQFSGRPWDAKRHESIMYVPGCTPTVRLH